VGLGRAEPSSPRGLITNCHIARKAEACGRGTAYLVLTAGLLIYALAYALVSPLMPMQFRQTQIEAAEITKLVRSEPAPIYRTGDTALNVLPYVPGRIFTATLSELEAVSGPAWMVLPVGEGESLLAQRPSKLHSVMQLGKSHEWRLLRLDK
jgi:hypothetical protein